MNSRLANKLTSKLVSKVDIFVSCRNLIDMDVFSKSDPMCIMYHLYNQRWVEFGRTERIMNELNPQFSTSFKVDFYFEEIQKVRFSLFDIDNDTPELDDDDYLGSAETTLGEIVSGSPLVLPLYMKQSRAGDGKIILRAVEETGRRDNTLLMSFSATRLDKKDFFGKSDPYLEFSKVMPDGGTQVTHRTEYIPNTLDPVWKEFEVAATRLCDGGADDVIKVDCYDYNNLSSPDLIGSFETTLKQLTSATHYPVEWNCVNMKKKAKKSSYKNSGIITLNSCRVTPAYSFLDFVFGGLQLKFCVSIDFTASNGDPSNPDSLHHMSPYAPNHYVRAIRSVGQVIKDYDSTQQFPCMGFGARIPPHYNTSHCFSLQSFTSDISYAHGIQGVLDSYCNCVGKIQLYGPTNFTPSIKHVTQLASEASRNRDSFIYHVLLIITDGVISDMVHTIQAIITASHLPLSIIIVGVGIADFDAMDRLDSDDRLLRDEVSGNVAKRDIVQFVPFREFEGASEEELGRQVLAELPGQVLSYYKMAGIPPAEPKTVAEREATPPNESLSHQPPYPTAANQPSSLSYPPSSTTHPPSHAPYPPSSTTHPPSHNPYPTSTSYPPSSTPYPPSSLPYPPQATQPACPYPNQPPSSLPPHLANQPPNRPPPPNSSYYSPSAPPPPQQQPPPPYSP